MSQSLIQLPPEQFEQFVDLSGDVIYQTDVSGRITYINGRVKDVLGYSPESLIGSHYLVLVQPEVRAEVFRFYAEQSRKEAGQTYKEFPAQARDGRRVWMQQHVQLLLENGHVRGFHGVARDISRIQQAERDLEGRDARMRLLSRLATIPGSDRDRLGKGLEEACNLLGLSTGIVSRISGDRYEVVQYWPSDAGLYEGQVFSLSQTYCDLVVKQESVVAIENMGESAHAGHPCFGVFGLQTYIGAPVYVGGRLVGTLSLSDAEARPCGFSGADTDFVALLARWAGSVLEQSIALKRIKAAEGQLKHIVEAAADGVTTCTPQGQVLSMNEAACGMLGLGSEPVGQDIRLFLPEFLRADRPEGAEQTRLTRRDGQHVDVDLTVTRVSHDGKGVLAGIFRDVTEQNRHATKLRRREAALRAFFDGTPFLMGILSLDETRLVHRSANAAAIDFLGLLAPPSLGTEGDLAAPLPSVADWSRACRQCLAERRPVRFELQLKGRWLNVTVNLINDNSTEAARFSYVAEDVTTEHRQAAELDKRRAEFEAIYASIPHAAVFANADRGLVAVNPAFVSIFGYSEEEALGLDADFLFGKAPFVSPQGRPYLAEVNYLRRDGTRFAAETVRVRVPAPDGKTLGWLALIRDVTERNENRERLGMQANILAHVRDAVVVLDADLEVSYWNAGAATLTGLTASDAQGRTLSDLVPFSWLVKGQEPEAIRSLVNTGTWQGRVKLDLEGGQDLFVEAVVSLMRDNLGDTSGMLVVARDITATVQLEGQLRLQARSDSLTRLPNRKVLDERIGEAIQERDKKGSNFALVFIDVDRFKLINDSLGHAIGDTLLQQIAGRITAGVHRDDLVARIGGDEFAVLLHGVQSRNDALEKASRMAQVLTKPFQVTGRTLPCSASLGLVMGDVRYHDSAELLRDADTAMYEAKRTARGTAVVFSEAMHDDVKRRFRLESDLACAVPNDELELYYQPIVDLKDGHLAGFEALVRWNHPEMGKLMPDEFLPMAAERDLLGDIDTWVLREAAAQLSCWLAANPRHARMVMHVNSSRESVLTPEYRFAVKNAIEEFELPKDALEIEITEHILLTDTGAAAERLASLKRLGVRLSVDDFGTGYSSLNLLHALPIDTVKTDRSLLTSSMLEARGTHILSTIATLTDALGLGLVAEGIETQEQMERLRDLGFTYGQGFFFSKARPAPLAERLLRTPGWLGYWEGDRRSARQPSADRPAAPPQNAEKLNAQRSALSPNSGTTT
ncbi:MAG: diguanylate cyclase (GGDEF)-like protein/PAS domain S-box-containing protein [Rhodothermales bacterium]|jgi:diguanylate cyclase (GGDEF)-like protein/PAS domain S-box-containing protein